MGESTASVELSVARRARAWPEVLAVSALSAGLAVLMALPQVWGLTTTVPENLGDPLLISYQISWIGHALTTDPGHLWTTNVFQGVPHNLAFTDTALGYFPLALAGRLFGTGQAAALATINLAGLFSTALAFAGAYALARALGARRPGALVAGAGFGFAPWRLEQVIHVNVESTGGIALSLALLAWGHGWSLRHGWRPETMRPGLAALGWAVACWQLSLGFAIGLPYAYALGIVMLLWALGWLLRSRRRLPIRLLLADGLGMLAFAAVGAYLAKQLMWVADHYPEARRPIENIPLFSPPWRGLVTAPEASRWWGAVMQPWRATMGWEPEMVLLPGFVLIGLALIGLFLSAWSWRSRLVLVVTIALTTVLALGSTFPGGGRFSYDVLYWHAPGWNGLRTPGRLIIWVTLGLCLLAAGAISELTDRMLGPAGAPRRPAVDRNRGALVIRAGAVLATLTLCLPATLVVLEGRGDIPVWDVPPAPVALKTLPQPVFVLPSSMVGDYHIMVWSTDGWPVIANGGSGFVPHFQEQLIQDADTFPDAVSVAALRRHGIKTVMIVRSRAGGTPFLQAADRSVAGLGITREDRGDAVVYDLR